jgi:predicted AlkP superfamily phosphohydrolase/phosphomutase
MLRRTLASAVLASALLAADVVLLILELNPLLSPLREAGALALSVFLPCLAAGTLALLALGSLGSLLRFWPSQLRRPIDGLPWFTSFSLVALTSASGLFALNHASYGDSIPLATARALERSALAAGAAALVLLGVGLEALLRPFARRGAASALVVLAAAAGLVVPLTLRPLPAPPARPVPLSTEAIRPLRRIVLVGVDGLSAGFVREGALRGRLPSFARLMRRGAHGPLRSLDPTEAPPLWTSIVTGLLPREHGVKSFTSYRLRGSASLYELLPRGGFVGLLERARLVSRVPVTAASRRRRALWEILNAFGIQAGVVRLWGTHPAEHVQGFMLSNYFHLLPKGSAERAAALYPGDLRAEVAARAVDPRDVDPELLARLIDLQGPDPPDEARLRRELVERALAPDLTYLRAGQVLRAAYDPPFFATYFFGFDVVGHTFLRDARPEEFGDVNEDERRRYGPLLDRYAALLGEWLGEYAAELRPDEVMIVVSAYGMRPAPLWSRAASWLLGRTAASGTHAGAPPGFLLALGAGIRPGAVAKGASLLDVAPTVLYLMGLPVARDMEGRVLTEMLDEDFTRRHPVTFIPSYESLAVTGAPPLSERDLPPLPEEGLP